MNYLISKISGVVSQGNAMILSLFVKYLALFSLLDLPLAQYWIFLELFHRCIPI